LALRLQKPCTIAWDKTAQPIDGDTAMRSPARWKKVLLRAKVKPD
jgi:hypothetical protein